MTILRSQESFNSLLCCKILKFGHLFLIGLNATPINREPFPKAIPEFIHCGIMHIFIDQTGDFSKDPSTQITDIGIPWKKAWFQNIQSLSILIQLSLHQENESSNAVEYNIVPFQNLVVIGPFRPFYTHLHQVLVLVLQEAANLILSKAEPLFESSEDVLNRGFRIDNFIPH